MHKDSPYCLSSFAAQAAAVMLCTLSTSRVSFAQALDFIPQLSQVYIVTPCHDACLSLYALRHTAAITVTVVGDSS